MSRQATVAEFAGHDLTGLTEPLRNRAQGRAVRPGLRAGKPPDASRP